MDKTYISLFSGIGGFDRPLQRAGWRCVAIVEKDPRAQAVLRRHNPDVPIFEDVRDVGSHNLPPASLICGGFPCFVAGTQVLTIEGYKPIETLTVGELVLTHTGAWQPITSVMHREAPKTLTLAGHGILPTVTTDEHPYWVRRYRQRWTHDTSYRDFDDPEWVEAKEIGNNFFVSQILPVQETEDQHSEAFWWLVGRYLADGWRRPRANRPRAGRVIIACNRQEAKELQQRIVEAGFASTIEQSRTAVKLHISRNELYQFLEPFGQYAHGKTLPGWCLGLPQEKAEQLLLGYLSGDGSRYGLSEKKPMGSGWHATSTSQSLALGLSLLAQKAWGVIASIYFNSVPSTVAIEDRVVNQRNRYEIKIPDVQRSAFLEGQYGWKKLRSSVRSASATVYNISVRSDESYIANGAIVHNCTDLSVAGRRAGLAGSESGLWYEYHRILTECQPEWVLIENVPGLFSSGPTLENPNRTRKGIDFAIVLAGLTGVVPVIPEGGWRNAGVGFGWFYNLAWRVLDAQNWGLAQRRERVFIVGRLAAAGEHPAQVLFERESRAGDTDALRPAWKEAARRLGGGLALHRWIRQNPDLATRPAAEVFGESAPPGLPLVSGSILASGTGTMRTSTLNNALDYLIPTGHDEVRPPVISHWRTLASGAGAGETGNVIEPAFNQRVNGAVSAKWHKGAGGPSGDEAYNLVIEALDARNGTSGSITSTLQAKASGGWSLNAMPLVFQRRFFERNKGGGEPSSIAYTITAQNKKGDGENLVAFDWQHSQSGRRTNIVRPGHLAGTLHTDQQDAVYSPLRGVRRLTPVECERLQGFPDDWTAWGIDAQGKRVVMSDTARYTQLGNAVAVPVAQWIVDRLTKEAE